MGIALVFSAELSLARRQAKQMLEEMGANQLDVIVSSTLPDSSDMLFSEHSYTILTEPSNETIKALTSKVKSGVSDDETIIIVSSKPLAVFQRALKSAGGQVIDIDGRNAAETAKNLLRHTKMEPSAQQLIIQHVGEDVSEIPSLLDTLKEVYGNVMYTREHVEPFLAEQGTVKIWTLLASIDEGKTTASLNTLARILGGGERPLSVAGMIKSHLERIYLVQQSGLTVESEAANLLGLKGSTYPAKKAIQLVSQYRGAAEPLLVLANETYGALRGGQGRGVPDRLALEILVARACTYPRK